MWSQAKVLLGQDLSVSPATVNLSFVRLDMNIFVSTDKPRDLIANGPKVQLRLGRSFLKT